MFRQSSVYHHSLYGKHSSTLELILIAFIHKCPPLSIAMSLFEHMYSVRYYIKHKQESLSMHVIMSSIL